MTPPPKGRFAPSPSGRMHLGNALCGLLAWLSVRSRGGRMVLRMEDLDPQRCRPQYALQLMEDLRWLGLDWDEGPGAAQPDAPYWQSQCGGLYQEALQAVARRAQVYPCYCTRADLHAASAPHLSDGTVLYSGRCRALTGEQREALQAAGRPPALRVAVPEETVSFVDGHLGPFVQDLARQCGDFVLRRSDGVYAYQLAVVVDDGRMGVTEVVRGQDLLSSTPRQIWLQRLLGLPQPQYRHIPLLVNRDGVRLSKRERSLDLGALRRRFSPAQLRGELAALAGLLEAPRPVGLEELLEVFSWEKVPVFPVPVPERLTALE